MQPKITIARHRRTNKVMHIIEVKNGKKCGCICLECGEKLIAANKGKKQQPHFRHDNESNCSGSPETGLHLLAKEILKESKFINIDYHWRFPYNEVLLEQRIIDIQPDIMLVNESGESWLVEIAVTHFIDDVKRKKIISYNVNCLEIDLRNVPRDIDKESLRKMLIDDLDRKTIIHHKLKAKMKEPVSEKTSKVKSVGLVDALVTISLVYLGIKGVNWLLDKY
ncbi:MAG: hypothetical protein CL596_02120 [Alteromonas sp.]|nr:hypothetical protein [Alteromonas sp.]MAY22489.1 hypothetical protein [Flavobacteriaceae bacterium]|tara:strand:- start:14703 stop:15371 length:669 start_codon:yes stop_codon:yes gene_type:complete